MTKVGYTRTRHRYLLDRHFYSTVKKTTVRVDLQGLRLIIIEPKVLVLRYESGENSCASISLKNVMYTMPVAFKVQTSAPLRYTITPPHGIIPPLRSISVEITVNPLAELPEVVPHSQDKFVVKSVVVPGGKENEAISLEWFTAKRKQVFSDHGMKVAFIGGGILRKLVAQGSMEEVREVLELEGSLIDSQDEHGCAAMHIAVLNGRPELVPLLLAFMPNLEVQNSMGNTALHEAAARGQVLIVELLLARSAKVDHRNASGLTPLHSAVMAGHKEVVSLLIENRADLDAVALDGTRAAHMAVEAGHHACLEMLLGNGADVDANGGADGEAPLHRAAAKGDKKAMEMLLRNGANRLTRNGRGRTSADIARDQGYPVFLVLDELTLEDDLRAGSRQGKMEVIQQCLTRGSCIDAVDEHGWTALHCAAFRGHMAIVSALLEKGANVHVQDDEGYTPLHCATEAGHRDIVVILLKRGASVATHSSNGQTALDLASLYGYADIVNILAGAKDLQDENGLVERLEVSTNGALGNNIEKSSIDDVTNPKSLPFGKVALPTSVNQSSVTLTV